MKGTKLYLCVKDFDKPQDALQVGDWNEGQFSVVKGNNLQAMIEDSFDVGEIVFEVEITKVMQVKTKTFLQKIV